MIENLETLLVLSRTGTMLEASTELRISQSAVSKRIAVLEKYYKRELTQKKGRRVELTQHGQHLVDKISPVLSELRDVFVDDEMASGGELVIGVSDAILSSWGARTFYSIQREMPETHFVFHAHRTPVVLDRIRSGEFIAGVCTGSDEKGESQKRAGRHGSVPSSWPAQRSGIQRRRIATPRGCLALVRTR